MNSSDSRDISDGRDSCGSRDLSGSSDSPDKLQDIDSKKRQRILAQKRNWARKLWTCKDCGSTVCNDNRSKHFKSNKHKASLIN